MKRLSPAQAVGLVIAVSTVVRLILASAIGLGVDESYVASVARTFSLSYFDHPPLHFWLIWLTTHLTGSENPLILRLPFILLFAGTTGLMFFLGKRLFGDWAGVYAAILLNLSAVFSLSTGSWLLPDGPLMFCLLAAALTLAKLSFPAFQKANPAGWLLAGGWLGLGLLSKYHALFLVFGYFLFLITSKPHRSLLLTAGPYLAVFTASLFFLPVLIWNYEHDWVSFLFQGSRGIGHGFYPARLLTNILGQAVWVLPWIWLPLIYALAKALAAGPANTSRFSGQNGRWFLGCLALGPILLFSLVSLWGAQGLFHWQAPGYLFAFPLLGEIVAKALNHHYSRWVQRWLKSSAIALLFMLLILGTQAAGGWMNSAFPTVVSAGDPTLEALDWRSIVPLLAEKRLLDSPETFVVAGHWIDAGKLDYALGGKLPVLCLNQAPHHFAYLHNPADFKGQDALIIGRKQVMDEAAAYLPYFDSVSLLGTLPVQRHGRTEMELALFYARNFKGYYPLPYGLQVK